MGLKVTFPGEGYVMGGCDRKESEKMKNYFNYEQCVKETRAKLIFSGSKTNLLIYFNP